MGDKERVRESLLVDGRQVVPEAMAARLQRAQATEAGQAAGSVKASSPVWAVLAYPGLDWAWAWPGTSGICRLWAKTFGICLGLGVGIVLGNPSIQVRHT